jgi:hypothetical protein
MSRPYSHDHDTFITLMITTHSYPFLPTSRPKSACWVLLYGQKLVVVLHIHITSTLPISGNSERQIYDRRNRKHTPLDNRGHGPGPMFWPGSLLAMGMTHA